MFDLKIRFPLSITNFGVKWDDDWSGPPLLIGDSQTKMTGEQV